MTPYDLPDVAEDLSPTEAGRMLDKIHSAVAQDAAHPYVNAHNPLLHAKWVSAVHRLHEIHAQREREPSVFDRALQEAAEKQAALQSEAEQEVETLAKYGVESPDLPEHVAPHHLTILKLNRYFAENDFDSLAALSGGEIGRLTNPAARATLWTSLSAFRQAQRARSPDLSARAGGLVEKVVQAVTKQYAGPSKPGAITEPVESEDDNELS